MQTKYKVLLLTLLLSKHESPRNSEFINPCTENFGVTFENADY